MTSRFARIALPVGTSSLLLGLSIKALATLALGPHLAQLDESVLRSVSTLRRGWLNGVAVDLTALGSGTLIALATVVVAALLVSTRDLFGAIHLGLAAAGAGVLTDLFKHYFARPRPDVVAHLVHVSETGFSYPSGHALGTAAVYFSFAMIARRHLPRHASREILVGFALGMILVIAASRVYLGVHYTSDVVSGVLVGVGWSLSLAGCFSVVEKRLTGRRSAPSLPAASA